MAILVVNAGSTSVKLSVIAPDNALVAHRDAAQGADLDGVIAGLLSDHRPTGVGHRVVHGGGRFAGPVRIDGDVRADLEAASDLAPLHNPPALALIDLVGRVAPDLPQAASFDTAFHHDLPPAAARYALPAEWVTRFGIRRYGFHGLSCRWSLSRAAAMLGRPEQEVRLVVCHLGGGASVTAVAGGRSVDTTMGFTPVEGLVMATRSGDVDPGLVAWLITHGIDAAEMADALEQRSGLLGMTGGRTGDLHDLLDARRDGDDEAAGAVEVYLHRLVGQVAAMAAAVGGPEAIVFTGGVGEHAGEIRAEVASRLGFLGCGVDAAANDAVDGDADITAAGAPVRMLVVAAREDLVVARECAPLLEEGVG